MSGTWNPIRTMTTKTRLNIIARRLERRAPAEPMAIRVVYHDDATGEDEPAGAVVADGREVRVIQLHWPEDEDDEKQAA